jgi:hypothetical protein
MIWWQSALIPMLSKIVSRIVDVDVDGDAAWVFGKIPWMIRVDATRQETATFTRGSRATTTTS